jgi:hypothetical protein
MVLGRDEADLRTCRLTNVVPTTPLIRYLAVTLTNEDLALTIGVGLKRSPAVRALAPLSDTNS